MHELTIAGTQVRTDSAGRYCLNDLHRAAGGAAHHQPGKFFANKGSQELVAELQGASPNSETPVVTVNDGRNNGTFVAKELVYAYAMWISPAFHLKVIRAYDALQAAPATSIDPMKVLNDPAAMRGLLLGYTEKVLELQSQVGELTPKAQALDLIEASEESLTATQAGKLVGMGARALYAFMHAKGWVYRQNKSWLAYQDRIKSGDLEYKEARQGDDNGDQVVRPYCHITPKGMVKLAKMLGGQQQQLLLQ